MDLRNKVVVITGASRGLGRALARACAREGANVVVSAREKVELTKVAEELCATPVVADVTREAQVRRLAKDAVKKFGRIDVWVNNAGVWMPHAAAEEIDMRRVHEMMEVNFFGLAYGSRETLREMKKRGSGVIVNILSVRAMDPRVNEAGYVATKFAADGFTKVLRLEAEPAGVAVIAVYPGGMQTDLFRENKPENYSQYMGPAVVAQRVVDNLTRDTPERELVIKRES